MTDIVKLIENKILIEEEQFAVEKKLIEKLEFIAEDVTDTNIDENAFIINHGITGSGKTNSAVVEALVLSLKTRREIDLFFKLQGVIDFAKNTFNKIIIWDEPAFTSLSQDHASRINKDLLRLINTSRLKRHVMIINFTKFWRFPVDVVVDTPRFFINMSDKNDSKGRFLYIPRKNLENLWLDFQKFRVKNYVKYKSFGGKMPFIYKKHFHKLNINVEGIKNATYEDYLRLRDKAVSEIGSDIKIPKDKRQLLELRLKVARMAYIIHEKYGIGMPEIANAFGSDSKRFREWRKIDLNSPISLGNNDFEASGGGKYVNTMDSETDDGEKEPEGGQNDLK